MGGSAVVGAEAFRRGSGFAPGARPWLRSSSPLLSKRHTRWRVRSDANSAEVTRYVDQCVPRLVKLVNRERALNFLPVGLRATSSRMLPGPTRLLLGSQLIAK